MDVFSSPIHTLWRGWELVGYHQSLRIPKSRHILTDSGKSADNVVAFSMNARQEVDMSRAILTGNELGAIRTPELVQVLASTS